MKIKSMLCSGRVGLSSVVRTVSTLSNPFFFAPFLMNSRNFGFVSTANTRPSFQQLQQTAEKNNRHQPQYQQSFVLAAMLKLPIFHQVYSSDQMLSVKHLCFNVSHVFYA
jgi:hypothetical protein